MLYIIMVQDFCPLTIKITQFPGGFRLNSNPRDTWYSLFSAIVDKKLLFKQNAMC